MGVACPRCKGSVKKADEAMGSLDNVELKIPKYTCTSCESRFYFEEDVAGYINLLTRASAQSSDKSAQEKKS
jgi:hypothetical protein